MLLLITAIDTALTFNREAKRGREIKAREAKSKQRVVASVYNEAGELQRRATVKPGIVTKIPVKPGDRVSASLLDEYRHRRIERRRKVRLD